MADHFTEPDLRELGTGERLRLMLTELGTTWVKLGQMLSLRPDLVGADVADELGRLQASVSTFDRIRSGQVGVDFHVRDEDRVVDSLVDGLIASASVLASAATDRGRAPAPTIAGISVPGLVAVGVGVTTWQRLVAKRRPRKSMLTRDASCGRSSPADARLLGLCGVPEVPFEHHVVTGDRARRRGVGVHRGFVVAVGEHVHAVAAVFARDVGKRAHERAADTAIPGGLIDRELVEEHLCALVGMGFLDPAHETDGGVTVVGEQEMVRGGREETRGRDRCGRSVEQVRSGLHVGESTRTTNIHDDTFSRPGEVTCVQHEQEP